MKSIFVAYFYTDEVLEHYGAEAVGTITPHSFRHFFVTHALRGTGNIRIAQELARHASISSTQIYSHLANEEVDEAYEALFNAE